MRGIRVKVKRIVKTDGFPPRVDLREGRVIEEGARTMTWGGKRCKVVV